MLSDKVCTDSTAQLTDVLFCVHSQGVYGHLIHSKTEKKKERTGKQPCQQWSVFRSWHVFCLYPCACICFCHVWIHSMNFKDVQGHRWTWCVFLPRDDDCFRPFRIMEGGQMFEFGGMCRELMDRSALTAFSLSAQQMQSTGDQHVPFHFNSN